MSTKQYQQLKSMKTCFSKQESREPEMENNDKDLPLPDVVLCSALAASIQHSRRQRQGRRRHPASVQTPAKKMIVPDVDPDLLMEPLIQNMEKISMDPGSSDDDMQVDDDTGSHNRRKRTSSASEAVVLSTISTSMMKTEKKLEDQPAQDTIMSTIKSFFNNIFSH